MVLKLYNYEESYAPVRFVLGEAFAISSLVITVFCCVAVKIRLFCRGRVDSIKKDLYASYSTF